MSVATRAIGRIFPGVLLLFLAIVLFLVVNDDIKTRLLLSTTASENRQCFGVVNEIDTISNAIMSCRPTCSSGILKSQFGQRYPVRIWPDGHMITIGDVEVRIENGEVTYFGPASHPLVPRESSRRRSVGPAESSSH